jgi:hypothetical protein
VLHKHRAAWLRAPVGARPRARLLFPGRFRLSLIATSRRSLCAPNERACRVIFLDKGKPVERLGRKAIGPSACAMRASRRGWQPGRRMDISVACRAHQDRAEDSLKAGGVDFAHWALTVAAWRRHAGSPMFPRCGTSAAAEGRCGATCRDLPRRLAPSTTSGLSATSRPALQLGELP